MNAPERRPLTPDFHEHDWRPPASVSVDDGFVTMTWDDGARLDAYSLWLAENAEGFGLEPSSRESMLEPRDLPQPGDLVDAAIGPDGAVELRWADGRTNRVHPGWLRFVADGRHAPAGGLPDPVPWTTGDLDAPPTLDGTNVLHDDDAMMQFLIEVTRSGLCRLVDTPTSPDFVGRLASAIGPIRETNFGPVWSVESKVEPDSTANTGLDLGQHTDLPTREVPPGFQFLHCLENTVAGGASRMSDGWSVSEAIRREHPEAYSALTELDWAFMNRSPDAEHRWIGPIIDRGSRHQPLTLRAFYPVRTAPHMDRADIPRAYEALRVFAEMARDQRFQLEYQFAPGDLVAFDNRRILHGRNGFDGAGVRHLRGCYLDHDDLYSRLRVLARRHPTTQREVPT
ncbi:MAG: TauD/TfdA family dioxygenase [Ilumatobacter sp.]|uniref:TauD/TfdA family dioxygenase n=1 Tax=Ilumatobacter sp. TaxID=1967498 RepID=UPI0026294E55|nr:TauD/TfdA family dioxygenase [Ilumatobacter sp.]MDJ0767634.1 TauD/TfdA family dioxygenase [Ilumatobacter sp.]